MRPQQRSVSRARGRAARRTPRATVAHAAPDSAALIARLARTPPASTAFTEVRFSALLAEPLVVSGMLDYEGAGVLNRRVETPYRESDDDSAARPYASSATASRRARSRCAAPRAARLRDRHDRLADGRQLAHRRALQRRTTAGDDERWRLDLEPIDDRLRQRLSSIASRAARDEPRCFVIVDTRAARA